jgi:hypothetical protein
MQSRHQPRGNSENLWKERDDSISIPRKRLAAVCGLFCPACHLFIGTKEDPKRLDVMAKRVQRKLRQNVVAAAG